MEVPLSCRAIITKQEEELAISFPAKGFFRYLRQFLACVFVIIWGLLLLVYSSYENERGFVLFVLFGNVLSVLYVAPLIIVSNSAFKRASVLISKDHLTICTVELFREIKSAWHRDEVIAVNSWYGLWVYGSERESCLLQHLDTIEIQWLASQIRQIMNVPEDVPPGSDEIVVDFSVTSSDDYIPGILRARRGEMILRNPLGRMPRFRFIIDDSPWSHPIRLYQWFFTPYKRPFILWKTDVIGRGGDDGEFYLQIAPSWRKTFITIGSDNSDELRNALARFWGAVDCKS